MTAILSKVVLCFILFGASYPASAASRRSAASLHDTSHALGLVDVFDHKSEGYACYRIPALVRLGNGTLLLFAEGRKFSCADHGWNDLVFKSSNDNGKTWSKLRLAYGESSSHRNVTIGNPAPVVLNTTHILLPYSRNNIEAGVLISSDGGASWLVGPALPVPSQWSWVATGPPGSLLLDNGYILIPADHVNSTGTFSHAYISSDGGATWTTSNAVPHGNEAQAAALPWISNTAVLLNMRTNTNTRQVAYSSDGGHSWAPPRPTLTETQCEGSMISLPTHPAGPVLVQSSAFASNRSNLSLHVSTDVGTTWKLGATVYPGSAAYSSLAAMGPAQVGVAFERDNYSSITFAIVNV